jgi:hypothetical protein
MALYLYSAIDIILSIKTGEIMSKRLVLAIGVLLGISAVPWFGIEDFGPANSDSEESMMGQENGSEDMLLFDVPLQGNVTAGPIVEDLDGDDGKEIVVLTDEGYLYIIEENGSISHSTSLVELTSGTKIKGDLAIGNVLGDDSKESYWLWEFLKNIWLLANTFTV